MNGSRVNEKSTILVVDDAPDNLSMMNNLLKDEYKVKIASNGEKALKIAMSEVPPDLILLDIMMPGMDGYEVCRILKSDIRTMSIPVIFVTARAEMEDEKKGLELGAIDYITKPIKPPIVMARVKNHLVLKAMADYLRDQNDWGIAEQLAYALKGLSGNVGNSVLQQLGNKLDVAVKARRLHEEVNARIDEPTLIAQTALDPKRKGKTPVTSNREKLDIVCEQLETLLVDGDTAAAEVMDANAELLEAAFPAHSHEIDNSIRSLDFGAALATLRAATGKSD